MMNMFWVKMLSNKKSLTLKWKRDVLNFSVFREKLLSVKEFDTSSTDSLRASTWIEYLKRLEKKTNFQHFFIQYELRRDFLNVVNSMFASFLTHSFSITSIAALNANFMSITDKTFFFVWDQIFDHQQRTVDYYLNQEIRFDLKICYLNRSFNKMIQKMIRLVSLTVDANVSTKLFAEQKTKLTIHVNVIKFDQRNKILTKRIHRTEYKSVKNAQNTILFQKKKKAEIRLNSIKKRLRVKMIAQIRKRHFRTIDIQIFNAQFVAARNAFTFTRNIQHVKSIVYNILERVKIVQLTCSLRENFSDRE